MAGTERAPNATDIALGEALRAIRRQKGVSQADLARALGLTFQQVQKYERGLNRISASKLWHAALILQVPIGRFFGERLTLGDPDHVADVLAQPETRTLLELWLAIPRAEQRDAVQIIMKALMPTGGLARLANGQG